MHPHSRRSLAALVLASIPCVALAPSCASDESAATTQTKPDDSHPECLPGAHDDDPEAPLHTPRWAFEPWLSKDYSSADDTRAFVKASLDRGIPVGVAVLDSPWETNYNTFEPDPNPGRYPEFASFVKDLGAQGVRVVVWVTQFVNSGSFDLEKQATTHYDGPAPGYELASSCGFFVNDGAEYAWWKGSGGAIDFFNPSAVAWWHTQQDKALDLGIVGFKLDFGDSYVRTDPVETAQGPVSHQEYSEAYYGDFYRHGVAKKGRDFLTMVRGWDESYDFEGRFYARPEHAPVVWAGDNRRDWVGLADALDTTFRSAAGGYVVVGSDIGGYLDHDDKDLLGDEIPFDTLVFARWTAMSALMPLMQLHGRADIMPWTVPDHVDETVGLYRYWATLHHELVPFFYSLAEETYEKRAPGIVRPVGADASAWANDYRFQIGDAFFVAPILDAGSTRDVALPAGTRYYDWWAPDADAVDGGTTLTQYDVSDRARIPLFVREGAIVPMAVDSDVVPVGSAASAGHLTVLAWPGATKSSFVLHDEDDAPTTIEAQADAASRTVSIDRAVRPVLLRVRADAAPSAVEIDGTAAAAKADFAALAGGASGYWYEAATRSVWVALPAKSAPTNVVVHAA